MFCLQGLDLSRILAPGQKLYSLSFDVLLNNNIALSYFIGKTGYLKNYSSLGGKWSVIEFLWLTGLLTDSPKGYTLLLKFHSKQPSADTVCFMITTF